MEHNSGVTCPNANDEYAVRYDFDDESCMSPEGRVDKNRLCCTRSFKPYKKETCHWVGKGDCAENRCDGAGDVTVDTHPFGDKQTKCKCESNMSQHCLDTLSK